MRSQSAFTRRRAIAPSISFSRTRRTSRQLLKRDARGRTPYAAQWNHAVDHMLGLSMSGDCDPEDPNRRYETEELARALAEGFFSGRSFLPARRANTRSHDRVC